ncbi:MAG: LysR family transcriptional regulator [Deltaproteobacteria bacterium]|nr:LysR family transcriptional regulator [Deltaproteobacteria bacterium]
MRFDLNLKQLKVFYYVAKHLSFTRAAEDLFITQPAVTMQISSLERQYGLPLFSRKKNELTLTEAGSVLLPYAEKLVEIGFEAERALFNLKANPQGVLRLGTTKAIARYLLSPYIVRFQNSFPRVRIKVDEGSSEEMALSVIYGRNDLAIVGRIPRDEKLEAIPFPAHPTDEMLLIVPEGHALAGKSRVTLEEIGSEPLIIRERGSGSRHVILEAFRERGITPTVLLEAGNVDFIKDLVERGAGVTILPRMNVDRELQEGRFRGVPLAGEGLAIHVDIVLPKDGYRRLAVESFLRSVLEPR